MLWPNSKTLERNASPWLFLGAWAVYLIIVNVTVEGPGYTLLDVSRNVGIVAGLLARLFLGVLVVFAVAQRHGNIPFASVWNGYRYLWGWPLILSLSIVINSLVESIVLWQILFNAQFLVIYIGLWHGIRTRFRLQHVSSLPIYVLLLIAHFIPMALVGIRL